MSNTTTTVATFTTSTTGQPVVVKAKEKVTGTSLLAAAYGGTVTFSKVRGTGTLRHWPVLAPESKERKQAEDIMARREKKETVEAIAKSLNVSVPTVRRSITAMAFTLELEAMKATERTALAKAVSAAVVEAPKEQKPAAKKAEEKKPAAKPAAKAQKAPKAKKETNTERLARMKEEGKVADKNVTEA